MRKLDLTGTSFGRLTALFIDHDHREKTKVKWVCLCSCGNRVSVRSDHLRRGQVASCGCIRIEKIVAVNKTHGMTKTRSYRIWRHIHSRCFNKNVPSFRDYGGRGISVCERWKSFSNFLADMGEAPDGMSIDRINNDLGYSPENCRWANDLTQKNNRRTNRYIEHNGVKKSAADWARETGVPAKAIISRVSREWPIDLALTKPPRPTGREAKSVPK